MRGLQVVRVILKWQVSRPVLVSLQNLCQTMSEENSEHSGNNNNGAIKRIPFPYEIKRVDEETNRRLLQDFTGERTGFVQVGPQKWFFPSGYEKEAENFYNFKPRPDDVWVVTFPRSGTTWTQEMVWLLANGLNYRGASEIPLTARFPFLEFSCFVHEKTKREFLNENSNSVEKCMIIEEISKPAWKTLERSTARRFIKTHLPFSLLPPNLLNVGSKVIYVARNPKDVAVSFYHLNRLIRTQGYQGDFPKYWEYFKNNLQPWTPYWNHIFEAWNRRNEKNLLFMFYEEMSKDLFQAIKRVGKFLEVDYTDEDLYKLTNHLKIENFKKNPSVNFDEFKMLGILINNEEDFVRRGKTGGWKEYFTKEMNQEADSWINENIQNTNFQFPDISK